MGPASHRHTVLIIDDHPIVLEGLARRINNEYDLIVCGEARTAHDGLEAVARYQPNVIVADLCLPDRSGLDLIKDIRTQTEAPIVVFSMYDDPAYVLRALKAGAIGYISKHEASAEVLAGIRAALNGETVIRPDLSKIVLGLSLKAPGSLQRPDECLADRELEIFEFLGKGVGTREIAEKLGRSIKTVEAYRARIKEKLRLKDAPALMREAVRWVETRQP